MDQGEGLEAWLEETWGGSDGFSFLMRVTWSEEYHRKWGVIGLHAIEERGHILSSERLPVDDEIDRMRKFGPKWVVDGLECFSKIGWPPGLAPYLYMRFLLQSAVRIAASRPPRDEQLRAASLLEIRERLFAAQDAVQACLEPVRYRGFPTGESGLAWEQRTGRQKEVFDAERKIGESLAAMTFVIEGIDVELGRLNVSAGRPKEEWKALFVAALALGWEDLTGKLPGKTTTTGDFVSFLNAAWASLPGEPPEINWDRPIRSGVRWAQAISKEIRSFAEAHPDEVRWLTNEFWQDGKSNSLHKFQYYVTPLGRLRERAKI